VQQRAAHPLPEGRRDQHREALDEAAVVQERERRARDAREQRVRERGVERRTGLDLVKRGVDVLDRRVGWQLGRQRLEAGDPVGVDADGAHLRDLGAEDRPAVGGGGDLGERDVCGVPVQADGVRDLLHRELDPIAARSGREHQLARAQHDAGLADQADRLEGVLGELRARCHWHILPLGRGTVT